MQVQLVQLSARHPSARDNAPAALLPLSLNVSAGEQLAVIGPSGSGKTTLLHAMACALKPVQGRLNLDGIDPWTLPTRQLQRLRGRLFLAPQSPPLPPRQRVITSVLAARLPALSLPASIRSLFYPTDIAAAEQALTRFDLGGKLWDRVDRLSGGERQRVGLARALLSPATLWLVDEPLSALDPTRSSQAIDSLIGAASQRQATLVVTLHQVEVALSRFARIVGLREGRLEFDLPAAQVTPERLASLYANHEDELGTPAALQPELNEAASLPAVMHCR